MKDNYIILTTFAPVLIIQKMNKNSIIGFILIAAIMVFYTIWMTPSEEELARKQHIQDSIMMVQKRQDSLRAVQAEMAARQEQQQQQQEVVADTVPGTEPSDNFNELKSKYADFANSAVGEEEYYVLESDLLKVEISTKGGYIRTVELKDYKTFDSLPLILFNPETTKFGLSFFDNNRAISTENFFFRPADTASGKIVTVSGDNTLSFRMRLYADAGEGSFDQSKYIEYVYTLKGNDYMFHFDINLVNMENVIAPTTTSLSLDWFADLRKQEKTVDRFNGSTIYYKYYQDDVEYLSETKDDSEEIKTRLKWVSFKQRFFSSTLIAKEYFESGYLETFEKENPEDPRYLKSMKANLEIPYRSGVTTSIPFSYYFGPNKFTTLKAYGLELERQIPIGWGFFLLAWINQYIVIPVFNWLGGYGWNYGIVILVLTILLKLFLFPIAYKTYMSSAKMRVLKPEVDEINAKYPKKEDSMKKQQAVMALYKSAGANPASGCVPMLLQMPILFAMFRFFPSSIELRQQSFLWAHDLSSYDSILDLPFNIPFYGDHVSLFTLLMTVSTVIYTYMNNQMMGSQSNQLPGMKTMMYLMPIMFLGIFNNYASGLSYYYFLANIITFGQMIAFRYMVNEDKVRAKIQANKKKPKKKSSFQKRLEEAAKKRGGYK
jgi:YidC/Oxa1 family membrane protein insertase